jgi:hypothetical protein
MMLTTRLYQDLTVDQTEAVILHDQQLREQSQRIGGRSAMVYLMGKQKVTGALLGANWDHAS